jgi:hypothetical protein
VAEMSTAQTLQRHDHETGAAKHEQGCVQVHVAIGAVEGQRCVVWGKDQLAATLSELRCFRRQLRAPSDSPIEIV